MLALSQARSYGAIIVVTFLAAAMGELYRPASHALIGDLIPPEHRVVAFGLYRFAVNLGFAAGPAMAGYLAEHSFFYLFLGDALTSAAYGLIALFALPHGLRTYSKDERVGEALRIAARDVPFLIFLVATLGYGLIEMQTLSTFSLYVTAVFHSTRIYGMLLSLNGVLIILCELTITNLTQRMSPRPVIALGYFLGGLGYARWSRAGGHERDALQPARLRPGEPGGHERDTLQPARLWPGKPGGLGLRPAELPVLRVVRGLRVWGSQLRPPGLLWLVLHGRHRLHVPSLLRARQRVPSLLRAGLPVCLPLRSSQVRGSGACR